MAEATPRIIFSTGSLYPTDIAEAFRLTALAGFEGIEVLCDERWSTRDPAYLGRLSELHGLPILSVHTPFDPNAKPDLPGWQDVGTQVKRIERALGLAEKLGAETLVVHLPRRFRVLTVQVESRRFRTLLPLPGQRDVQRWMEKELPGLQRRTPVRIAVENMPVASQPPRSVNPWWRNDLERWPTVHTDLTLDVTHWATWGIDPLAALAAAGNRLRHVHLSNHCPGKQHRQLVDQGDLDLRPFLRALKASGFGGLVCVELDPSALPLTDTAALETALSHNADFCREHLRSG